jgi:hypothetical protein
MVRYTERASEGLAHHLVVDSDELRLKTNVRGGPLSGRVSDAGPARAIDPVKGPASESLR